MTIFQKIWSSFTLATLTAFLKYKKIGNDSFFLVKNTPGKGEGLFTAKARSKGELVFIATGKANYAHFEGDDVYKYPDWYSVAHDIWIDIQYPYIKINHSCDPNTGIDGTRCFVALRDIRAGEELTFDYSTTEEESNWIMPDECACGSANCTKKVGPVWTMSPARYQHASPYIPKYFRNLYQNKKHIPS